MLRALRRKTEVEMTLIFVRAGAYGNWVWKIECVAIWSSFLQSRITCCRNLASRGVRKVARLISSMPLALASMPDADAFATTDWIATALVRILR